MSRRVVITQAATLDRETLQVITVYEEGLSKQDVRNENPYSKKHGVLYQAGGDYEYKN
ncbi:hypothetical protein ABES80_01035 [Bacillus gobiensis]|uniref:hypothetical protein n=1 Tax=Bacillus gobiensis TaxID=1441095 RepID=UPI003D19E689